MSWELIPIRGEKTYPQNSVLTACETNNFVVVNSNKKVLHYWNIVISK